MEDHRYPSPTEDVLAYGPEGIDLHRGRERRAIEQRRHRIAASLDRPRRRTPFRQWLGAVLVRTGTRIAGDRAQPTSLRREVHS